MADHSGGATPHEEFDFSRDIASFLAHTSSSPAENNIYSPQNQPVVEQLDDTLPEFSLPPFPTPEEFLNQASHVDHDNDSDDDLTLEDALAATRGTADAVPTDVAPPSHDDAHHHLQGSTFDKAPAELQDGIDASITGGPDDSPNVWRPEWPSISGIYHDEPEVDTDDDEPKHTKSFRPREVKYLELGLPDQDESGDYDPDGKAPCPPKPVTTKRRSPTQRQTSTGDQPRKPSQRSTTQLRRTGASYCVALSLTSKKAKKWLAAQLQPDNWPYDETVDFEDQMDIDETPFDFYDLRERADNAKDEALSLKGHPAARGCKNCLKIHLDCSMLRPDGSYPCEACAEGSEICEPVVPPKWKQACENCTSSGEHCSYAQFPGGDHSTPCKSCELHGFKCVAGPQYDPLRTRIGDDGKPATPVKVSSAYPRNMKTCAPCRRAGRWCSLSNHKTAPEPPCNACRKERIACTFEAATRQRKEPGISGKTRAARAKKTPLSAGTEMTITTTLAHPITFFAPEDSPVGCHWCTTDNPAYAIFGLGRREVKVLAWPNGQGYDEISGGHTGDGLEASCMCTPCAMGRVRIVQCAKHELRSIPGLPASLDDDIAARERRPRVLVEALMGLAGPPRPAPPALRAHLARWCAVCPSPAQFECCAGASGLRPTADVGALVSRESAAYGCGLRLCADCKNLAENRSFFRGDFQQFLKTMGRPPKRAYPRGTRADWEFLKRDSLLMRQYHALLAANRAPRA